MAQSKLMVGKYDAGLVFRKDGTIEALIPRLPEGRALPQNALVAQMLFKACLDEDMTSGASRMLTGEKLTPEQTTALEAKKKERDARCKPEADRLAQLQKEILAAQQ